jgi:hypothetical protein
MSARDPSAALGTLIGVLLFVAAVIVALFFWMASMHA